MIGHACKRLQTRVLRLKLNFFYSDASITKSRVVSLGVTLRMMVKLNSNLNVTIEIIYRLRQRKQLINQ